MLITEKSLSDLCAPCSCLSPFYLSLCPTQGSQERSSLCCIGHLFTWIKKNWKKKKRRTTHPGSIKYHTFNVLPEKKRCRILSTVSVSCYHLSSKSDMLIRSMSALDPPPPPSLCFNHSLEADGVEGGSTHAFHALSGRRLW